MTRIVVAGSGGWGTALACMLANSGRQVVLMSHFEEEARSISYHRENREFLPGALLPDNLTVIHMSEKCLAQYLPEADAAVIAAPSKHVRATMERIQAYIAAKTIFVSVSKGLDSSPPLRLSEVIALYAPKNRIAALSGPSHAEEVARNLPTACVAASEDYAAAKAVQDIFMNRFFRVYASVDLLGVELGGALKNVIALAAGISDGLGYGDNAKAALMTRGMAEITRLGVAMGGMAGTFAGLSGMGDLIVTCTSMHSRNRRAGILLGQGKSLDETLKAVHMVVEGVNTAHSAYELSKVYGVEMPITYEINQALFCGKDPAQAVVDLMTRDKTSEGIEHI
ncbi:MAG: NAD(P)-dependent glycerol-3-phosphate dehydrogenase [Clostridiales bacterium]|jgi:glycerol-3-phosphate dehydrogenase (NAD(P)+)|nr:NAD(P)-dependent glycerol-3-phosphate dehydrogenase [Clostridiales bacterium]